GPEKDEALAERRGTGGHAAYVRNTAMTCPDAEHAASLRDSVHRRRRRGRDGGMTGGEVGHARGEADARGGGSGQGHGDPRIHGVARRVRDADEVEAMLLTEPRHAPRVLGGVRPEEEPDAHAPPLRVWRADSR